MPLIKARKRALSFRLVLASTVTAIGTSIVGLAGQTRIREYVDVGLGTMMSSSSSAAGEAHTARVCSEANVAPELLLLRSYHEESAVYGRPLDVWSAGVVLFEVATMTAFLHPGSMPVKGIAQRIGPPPAEYGPCIGAGGLEACLCGHWLAIGLMCLDWQPQRRTTAAVLASHPAWDQGTVAVRDDIFLVSPPAPASAPASSAAAASAVDVAKPSSTDILLKGPGGRVWLRPYKYCKEPKDLLDQ